MDQPANRRVAVLAIRPPFADAIIKGNKRVEFRRTPFAESVSHVVMYATAPVQGVVGVFEVEGIHLDRPSRIWRKFRLVGGVTAKQFKSYYSGSQQGVAILVGKVSTFDLPIPLSSLGVQVPPQSFQYLDDSVAGPLIAKMDPREDDLLAHVRRAAVKAASFIRALIAPGREGRGSVASVIQSNREGLS